MAILSIFTLFAALRLIAITSSAPAPAPAPVSVPQTNAVASTSSYWLANIARQGEVAFCSSNYTIFRNVMDYGAKGDGATDDTVAINAAISAGNRCGQGCDSSTITPALVYFPPGTYMISAPLVQLYYTQFVGDAVTIPTIKATAGFKGIALIDSDPYLSGGASMYTNQVGSEAAHLILGANNEKNNFFRQVRNFVVDLTAMPVTAGAGIHVRHL